MSLFVGFTPYHAHVAGRLIDRCAGPVFCHFSKRWPRSDRGYERIAVSSARLPGLAGILSFLRFALTVRYLQCRGVALDVYMPHPGNIFSNYLFFSRRGAQRVFLYEDGILNYYDALQGNPFVGPAKRWLARLGGMPYHDYPGHLAGYDAGRYDGAFLSMPELAVRLGALGEVQRLPVETRKLQVEQGTVLFLDQNVAGILAEDQRHACLEDMFARYPLSTYRYVYKPHHDFRSALAQQMTALPAEEEALPAELLVERLRPALVVSFFSSALINIRNAFPDVCCISLAAAQVSVTRDGCREALSVIFRQAGVECLEQRDARPDDGT